MKIFDSHNKYKYPYLSIALILYIGFSPVYWLPGLDIENFNTYIKSVFLVLIVLSFFVFYLRSITTKYTSFFLIAIFSLLLSFIFHLNEFNIGNLIAIFNLSAGFFTIHFAYNYKKYNLDFTKIFNASFLIVWSLSVICILDYFVGLNVSVPKDIGISDLYVVGFTGKRTGWSGSIALFVPLAFLQLRKNSKSTFLTIIKISPILLSQYFSGGRAGLLASIVGLFYLLEAKKKYYFYIKVIVLVILVYYVLSNEVLLSGLRINSDNLEYTFSNRLIHYAYFTELFNENIFFGMGSGGTLKFFSKLGIQNEFHNAWIRTLLDFGIFHGLVMIVFLGYILKNVMKRDYSCIFEFKVFKAIVISGLIPTFFEPRFIIGDFQNVFLWYLSLGFVLFYNDHVNKEFEK